MVIVSADDPSLFSSQNEQDNRYYAKLAGLPMLSRLPLEEAEAMTLAAFALSERLKVPVLLRTTTRVNHTRGPRDPARTGGPAGAGPVYKDPFHQVMVPAVARQAHVRLLAAQDQARALAETSDFNEISGTGAWGIVTSRGGRDLCRRRPHGTGPDRKSAAAQAGIHPPPARDLAGRFSGAAYEGAGGGGTGAVPGRGSQGHRPGSRAQSDHPGQRSGPLFPPLRVPPGPGAGGGRPLFRGGLGGAGAAGS